MLYLTADTHFYHRKMLELRPEFESVEDMNQTLIDNWNKVVTDKDEIWHLGDVSFGNWEKTTEVLKQLRGRKHLVLGNHDHQYRNRFGQYFMSVQSYKEIKWKANSLILSHFPFLKWNRGHYGTIHCCGHCHGNLSQENIRRFDVGVDTNWANYSPISVERIIKEAELYPIAPYHHT